jgi:multicomponent Na+:H+ antiporter subunit E
VRTYGFWFTVLFLFWLIITESLALDSLVLGGIFCVLIIRFNKDLLPNEKEFPVFNRRRLKILLKHIGLMIVEIIRANISVLKIVLSPGMEEKIHQGLVVFSPDLKYEWNEVLFANSINLTPGTLTLELEKDVYTVHTIDIRSAESLVSWKILDNLRQLEEGSDD